MDSGGVRTSELTLARAVAAAVRAVPGVADISPGRLAEAATYGPSEKVSGVVVGRDGDAVDIEVHLCVLYADSLVMPELAAQVRSAVRQSAEAVGAGPLGRIDVVFDEIRVGEDVSE